MKFIFATSPIEQLTFVRIFFVKEGKYTYNIWGGWEMKTPPPTCNLPPSQSVCMPPCDHTQSTVPLMFTFSPLRCVIIIYHNFKQYQFQIQTNHHVTICMAHNPNTHLQTGGTQYYQDKKRYNMTHA
jgi:hypothetical protein